MIYEYQLVVLTLGAELKVVNQNFNSERRLPKREIQNFLDRKLVNVEKTPEILHV